MPESFFNEVADLSLKKETVAQVFSYEFYEIFKNNFFAEQLRKAAFVCYKLPQSIVIVVEEDLPKGFLWKGISENFHKDYGKTLVMEAFFNNKVLGL